MPQITLHDVSISYHGPQLLEGVSAKIDAGEKIGLLGRNGAGKTTFMRMIAGLETPDHGVIEITPGTKITVLPQDVPDDIKGRVRDVIALGTGIDPDDTSKHWSSDQMVERTCTQMQLDGDAIFEQLSTGMKRRVILARAIVGDPDVLLLDEPTNHLDISSIEWLEGFLSRLRTTLIFVTHDRQFLVKLAKRILEIDRGKLFDWSCDYTTFLQRKEEALAAEEKQQALFDKKLAQEEVWIRQGIKARRTRNEGRVRALEAMRRERSKRQEQQGTVKLEINSGERSGALVIDLKGASFGYDGRTIVPPLTTTIMRGDKVGIIGPNGAGKSTLLKGLLGGLQPLSGTVRQGTNLQVAYFDQTRDQLDPDKTAEENVGNGKPTVTVGGKSRHVIGYLQDFLFTPEQARSSVRFFSGGQRNRLLLAKLFARSANLLVLDEPTNDLDTETLEMLEERLVEYDGTVLLVSHDRAFLNNVVTSSLVFENGKLREYFGGYDDWVRQRQTAAAQEKAEPKKEKSNRDDSTSKVTEPKKKLSFKEIKELEQIVPMIEKLEAEVAALHEKMADPDFYKQAGPAIAKTQSELQTLEEKLAKTYAKWEDLESRK